MKEKALRIMKERTKENFQYCFENSDGKYARDIKNDYNWGKFQTKMFLNITIVISSHTSYTNSKIYIIFVMK